MLDKLIGPNATQTQHYVLIASILLGALYFLDGFEIGLPYPADVVLKASGIVLLGALAWMRGYRWLAAGLLLGSAGDAFLALQPTGDSIEAILRSEALQQGLGIVSFGLGHIVYIGLFAAILRQRSLVGGYGFLAAGGLAVFGAIMLIALQPHFGELRVAASIYNGIIMAMAILAVMSRAHPLAIAGALLFVVSDSVLAWRMFAGALDWAGPVVWATYYLGQAGICLGLARER